MAVIYMPEDPRYKKDTQTISGFNQVVNYNRDLRKQKSLLNMQEEFDVRRDARKFGYSKMQHDYLNDFAIEKEKRHLAQKKELMEFDYSMKKRNREDLMAFEEQNRQQYASLLEGINPEDMGNPMKMMKLAGQIADPKTRTGFMNYTGNLLKSQQKAQLGVNPGIWDSEEWKTNWEGTIRGDPESTARLLSTPGLSPSLASSILNSQSNKDYRAQQKMTIAAKEAYKTAPKALLGKDTPEDQENQSYYATEYMNIYEDTGDLNKARKEAIAKTQKRVALIEDVQRPDEKAGWFKDKKHPKSKEEAAVALLKEGYMEPFGYARLLKANGFTDEEIASNLQKYSPDVQETVFEQIQPQQVDIAKSLAAKNGIPVEELDKDLTAYKYATATSPKEKENIDKEAVEKYKKLSVDTMDRLEAMAGQMMSGFDQMPDEEQARILFEIAIREGVI